MKKSNSLNHIYALLAAEPTTKPNHYLFLLGTDTKFTPRPSPAGVKEYVRGETLSYMAQVAVTALEEVAEQGEKDSVLSYSSDSVDVLNGPTTFGAEVGQRVAQAVFLALRAVASGKTTLDISAHSRGAVEAILVIHELKRIENALKEHPEKSLYNILLETPCKLTKTAFRTFFQDTRDASGANVELRQKLQTRLSQVKINAFLIDPVPGDTRYGVPGFGWHDPRFYLELPCDKIQLILSRDERTNCFFPIIPTGIHPIVLPGHHGTASGNLYSQQYQEVPTTIASRDTYHVQELVICKLLQFFHHTSATEGFSLPHLPLDLHHSELDRVVCEFLCLSEDERAFYILNLYQKIQENNGAYAWFQTSSYPWLGLASMNGQRYVHLRSSDYSSMAAITPAMNGDIVNTEHATLVVKDVIHIPNIQEAEPHTIVLAINDALTKVIAEMINPTESPSPLKSLLTDPKNSELFFEALSNLVDSVGQKYLSNHLTPESRMQLLEVLKAPFKTLETGIEELGINEENLAILKRCQGILQTGVKNTIEAHYRNILAQAEKIDAQITLYIKYPDSSLVLAEFQQAIECDPAFTEFSNALVSSDEKSLETFQTLLKEEIARIDASDRTSEEKEDLTKRLVDSSSLLNQYQDAKGLSIEQYLQTIEELHDKAFALKMNLSDLNKLTGAQALALNPHHLDLYSTRLLMLAGKFLKEINYDLRRTPEGVSEAFYRRIKALAIALGAPSPEVMDLTTRIQELEEEKTALETQHASLTSLNEHELSEKRVIETERTDLQRQLAHEKTRTKTLCGRYEIQCGNLIHNKLLPLSEQYLLHLWHKAKAINSSLSETPDFNQPLLEISQDFSQETQENYTKIKNKFDAVYRMKCDLEIDEVNPSDRLQGFMAALSTHETSLKTHRDASWKQYAKACLAAIAIIFTGIIPGLIGFATYSLATGRSPLFFTQSKGQRFVDDCRQQLIPACN
ncbi:hypothetical protein [Legionella impletisoli]|uniref:Uncharacterized protein n=1 Tax=Legionella impletisoli TaxID=343510 RepID=A0A917JVR0_9GAMM|nr:hypothetical protein [Legionella impletisoli]GGI88616.1 hypothetical protein GCM10007966_16680 [Legionella impletisoli]